MASASLQFGNLTAGNGNYIFQGIQNAPLTSALERKHFRHGNPPPLNRNFLGRNDEISAIMAAFREADAGKQKRYVIYGMAGIGKSEVCVKLINDMQSEFWGLFWIDVSDVASAEESFKQIADQIRPGMTHQTLGHALSALAEVNFHTHPWLLILDNTDERREDYARFFPSVPGGSIILTSRNHECAVHETVGSWELEPISFQDSVRLLFKAAKLHQLDWELYLPQAEMIVELLGSHTLTLVQAGAFISRDVRNWNEYPKLFKENRQHLLAISWNQAQSKYGNVYATFEVSARALESDISAEAKDALSLLAIFAMFHHNGFPTSIFTAASDGFNYVPIQSCTNDITGMSAGLTKLLPEFLSQHGASTLRLQAGLHCLESLSFIKQTSTDDQDDFKLVSMHPLAHSWAKDRLDQRRQKQAWMMTGSIIAFSTVANPQSTYNHDFSKWELRIRQLQPHISSFVDNGLAWGPRDAWVIESRQVYYVVANILDLFQLHERLKQFLLDAFEALEADPTRPENADLLPLYYEMASVWYQLRQNSSSMDLWQKILTFQETNSFSEERILASKHGFAVACMGSGAIIEAITQLESIVSKSEGMYSAGNPLLLTSQYALGFAYRDNGQEKEGLELLEHVYRSQQGTVPETDYERLIIEHELGLAYLENSQPEKAIVLLEHVARIRRGTLLETSLSRLAVEEKLGLAYLENGQAKEATESLEYVVRIRQQTLQETDDVRLVSEHTLGMAYKQTARPENALQLFEHVARIERATLHPADPSRLATLRYLPDLYIKFEQPKKAKEVAVEFDNSLRSLPIDDARWREHGKWLATWKQYFGIEEKTPALGECGLYPAWGTQMNDAHYLSSPHPIFSPVHRSTFGITPQQELRVPSFREILALTSTEQRLAKYNQTRKQFADMDTGLRNWVSTTLANRPEHAELANLLQSADVEFESGNRTEVGPGKNEAGYDSEGAEDPPYWKRLSRRVMRRDKKKERK